MELIVQDNFSVARIYLRYNKGDQTVIVGQKDGMLIEQTLDHMNATADPFIPLLEMNRNFAQDFFKAVGDYNSANGIKTENENLQKGKLLATEKHLEDLRTHFAKAFDAIINTYPNNAPNNEIKHPF